MLGVDFGFTGMCVCVCAKLSLGLLGCVVASVPVEADSQARMRLLCLEGPHRKL